MDPIDENKHYKFGVFYFNPDDKRVVVPKRQRASGFTINFARKEAFLVLMAIVLLIAILFTIFV
jgi:uncharacterized membrane protein